MAYSFSVVLNDVRGQILLSNDQRTVKKLDISEKLPLIESREFSSAVDVQFIRRCLVGLARLLDGFTILFFGLHNRIGRALLFHGLC